MIISKIGIHSIGDKRNSYKPFLQTIADAGRQLSLVKCRDDFGAVDEPLQFWPDITTIGTVHQWDGEPFDAQRAYRLILTQSRLNPRIKYWEFTNERDGDYKAHADMYIDLLPMLKDTGLGLCLFNCASGTPQIPTIDPQPYAEVARACAFAKAGGYNAILGLHEYQHIDKPTIGRYRILADYLQARNALIPIAITEWGWETCENSPQKYLDWAKTTDSVYMGDDRVIGLAMWTLGGRGWQASNFAPILPALGQYIATAKPITPAPQPPAPPPPPQPVTIEDRLIDLERRIVELERRG